MFPIRMVGGTIFFTQQYIKSGLKLSGVFDGSNESLYHADDKMDFRLHIHSPSQTISDLSDVYYHHIIPIARLGL